MVQSYYVIISDQTTYSIRSSLPLSIQSSINAAAFKLAVKQHVSSQLKVKLAHTRDELRTNQKNYQL